VSSATPSGRIVKSTGDELLVEFASVVDAVSCAVAVQRAMAQRNAEVDPARRIDFRMGINFGDVIKDGRDIYGDGVNAALSEHERRSRAEVFRRRHG
jgi:adenylate cyclase